MAAQKSADCPEHDFVDEERKKLAQNLKLSDVLEDSSVPAWLLFEDRQSKQYQDKQDSRYPQ